MPANEMTMTMIKKMVADNRMIDDFPSELAAQAAPRG